MRTIKLLVLVCVVTGSLIAAGMPAQRVSARPSAPAVSPRVAAADGATYLPLAMKGYVSPPPSLWTIIMQEDFEGEPDPAWRLFDNDGATNGTYHWAKRTCRPYEGAQSGWAVGGGTDGAALPCGSPYPPNVQSWMIYGPFSLADATAAEMRFKLWLNSETGHDQFCWMAAADGVAFNGLCTSGNLGGWIDPFLDLSNVRNYGSMLGDPEVWVAFMFVSSGELRPGEGAFVDNVVLRKCTLSACP